MDLSLLDMVLTTTGVLLTMALLTCLCCLCMKFSDLKMQRYVLELAKQKGINIDVEKLKPPTTSTQYSTQSSVATNETCMIFIPDVALIL